MCSLRAQICVAGFNYLNLIVHKRWHFHYLDWQTVLDIDGNLFSSPESLFCIRVVVPRLKAQGYRSSYFKVYKKNYLTWFGCLRSRSLHTFVTLSFKVVHSKWNCLMPKFSVAIGYVCLFTLGSLAPTTLHALYLLFGCYYIRI